MHTECTHTHCMCCMSLMMRLKILEPLAMCTIATRGALSPEIGCSFPCEHLAACVCALITLRNCGVRGGPEHNTQREGQKLLMFTVKSILFHINEAEFALISPLAPFFFLQEEKENSSVNYLWWGLLPFSLWLFTQTTRLNNTCFHRDNRSVWE